MKKFKKQIAVLLLSLFTVTTLAACGSGGNKEQGKDSAKDDYVVNLGYYNCDHMTAAVVARDAGIFDELGLKVNITGNGKVPEAMSAGKMDVGYIGYSGLMKSIPKGAPIFVAANNHLTGSYYLVISNEIKDPKDLVGKKVAAGTDPEKNSLEWIDFTKELGIPAEGKSYEIFDMSDKDEYFALKAGKLDAFTACDPWGSMAEYEGTGYTLTNLTSDRENWGECCAFVMSKKFAEGHPELAKKMILAHSKALQYIYTHPAKSAKIFADNYKVPEEVGLMTIYKKTVQEGRTLDWEINEKDFQHQIDIEKAAGILETAPTLEQMINREYLDAAGTDDFKTFIKEKVDPIFPVGMNYEDWKKKAAEIDA